MQIEIEIKDILGKHDGVENKVREISKLMNWNEQKTTDAIIKHGTSTDKQRSAIIEEFWGNLSDKNKRR